MSENVNIKAALDNLWDVMREEGFELTQYYGRQQPPDGAVEIVRTHPPGAWSVTDVRVYAVPASAQEPDKSNER